MFSLASVAVVVNLVWSAAHACPLPPPCACNAATRVISCSYRNLTQIPKITLTDDIYARLILNGNLLTQISSDAFSGLHVHQIQIRQNPLLTLVRSGAFRSLPVLQDLILDLNDIVIVESEAFVDLPELRRLWLGSNRLESLENSTFVNLPSLVDLSLDGNMIKRIEIDSVSNAPNIEKFDVSHNRLTTLDFHVVCGWRELHILNLSNNPLPCDCSLGWVQVWRAGHVTGSHVQREMLGTCTAGGVEGGGGEVGLYVHVFQDCQVIERFAACGEDVTVAQPVG